MTKRPYTHNEDRRHRTEPRGVPIEMPEDVTGQYEGEELRKFRSRRSTYDRLERLEDHKDASLVMFTRVDTSLGELKAYAELAAKREDDRLQREHEARESDRRRKWILALITGIAAAVVGLIGALR